LNFACHSSSCAAAERLSNQFPVAVQRRRSGLAFHDGVFLIGIGATLPRSAFEDELIPQVPYFTEVLGGVGEPLVLVLSMSAIVSTFNAVLIVPIGGAASRVPPEATA